MVPKYQTSKCSGGFVILPDCQGGTPSPAARMTSQDTQWIEAPVLNPNLENNHTDWDVCHQDFSSA